MKLLEFVFLLTLIFQLVTSKPSPNEFISPEKDSTDYDVQEIKRNIEPPEKIVNINLKNEGGLKITYPYGEIIVPSERKNVHIKTIDVFEEKDRNPSSEKFNRNEKDENKENGKGSQDHFSENTFFPIFYNYYFNQDPKSIKPNIQQAANYLPYVLQHQPQNSEGNPKAILLLPNIGFQNLNVNQEALTDYRKNASSILPLLKSSEEAIPYYRSDESFLNFSPRNQNNSLEEANTEKPGFFTKLIDKIKALLDPHNWGLEKMTLWEMLLDIGSNIIRIISDIVTLHFGSLPGRIFNIIKDILRYYYGTEPVACKT